MNTGIKDYVRPRKLMEDLMREVGKYLSDNFGRKNKISYKEGNEVVTNVDLEAEKIIKDRIKKSYSGHSIISEEHSSRSNSPYEWIVDPLDGTNNFSRGIPIFGSAIALVKDKEVVASAIIDPYRDKLFSADKVEGLFLNGKKFNIKPAGRSLEKSMLNLETRFFKGYRKNKVIDEAVGAVSSVRVYGSAAASFAFLLSGNIDILMAPRAHSWDIVGGAFLVKQGGGEVFNFSGERWSFGDAFLIAFNPSIKKQFINHIFKK